MADNPPYMNAYGLIPKILGRIQEAQTPPRFTQDFLGTNLGFTGGSANAFIPFAKRIGLLASDGSPTDLYRRFRNSGQAKAAMADALRKGYPSLFARNEYAYKLDRKKLEGLIVEATGLKANAKPVKAMASSFDALKQLADFEATGESNPDLEHPTDAPPVVGEAQLGGLHMSYTINLNLPITNDIAVFNAIFKALKENLLKS